MAAPDEESLEPVDRVVETVGNVAGGVVGDNATQTGASPVHICDVS